MDSAKLLYKVVLPIYSYQWYMRVSIPPCNLLTINVIHFWSFANVIIFKKGMSSLNCILLIISKVGHLYFLVDYVFLTCSKIYILDINPVSILDTVDSH